MTTPAVPSPAVAVALAALTAPLKVYQIVFHENGKELAWHRLNVIADTAEAAVLKGRDHLKQRDKNPVAADVDLHLVSLSLFTTVDVL